MLKKPEKETTLNLPTSDALSQALSFLQNANSPEDIKMSDIKKAVACIETGEKEEENLLPHSEDNEEILTESTESFVEEEKTEEPDITQLFQEIKEDEKEIEQIEESEITTYKNNLPVDTAYVKEMNDTIEQSLYAYRELFDLGINASSGKGVADIANASNAFLKLAYEARNSKLKHRMDLYKLEIEERKLKLQELKAFKDVGSTPNDTGFISEETEIGIKMTPSLREQLLKENQEESNKKDDSDKEK